MSDTSSAPSGADRGGPPGVPSPAMMAIWGVFLLIPIVNALTRTGQPTIGHWAVVVAATVFSATYFAWGLMAWDADVRRWRVAGLTCLQLPIAIALTVLDQSSWGYLFCYSAACLAIAMPARMAFSSVLATAVICFGSVLVGGGDVPSALSLAFSAAGIGALMTIMRSLHTRNAELREARAALANVAVAAERERFARDLHDLLGHSLSVIAIKAELAGRLLPDQPGRAATEVADVEDVARQALGEVRQAVAGYRQPTLAGELEGARMALTAAGIEAAFEGGCTGLDPDVEAVLAWTVREGATNVIRHSGARHCSVTITAQAGAAEVEVLDDGAGAVTGPDSSGNGLAGLRERAVSLDGRIEAGGVPGGGYRLAVSVPADVGHDIAQVGGGQERR